MDKAQEQIIIEAARNCADNLDDLLQVALETMPEEEASQLLDRVHQIMVEGYRDAKGWNTEEIGRLEYGYEEWIRGLPPMPAPSRHNELYGSWLVESEEERKLRELAETYHTGCETYDRRVCSGTSPRTGDAMPVTPHEMGLINRHARQMRDTAIQEGERLGFSPKQVEEAIRKYSK